MELLRRRLLLLFVVVGLGGIACTHSHPASSDKQPIRVSAENTDAAEPALATGPDGTVYVAWVEHRPNREADVMIRRIDSTQIPAPPVRVNPVSGAATAWRGDPPTVSISHDGTVSVGWTARVDSGSSHGTDVYVSQSHDGARSFNVPVKVNDDTRPAQHGMHSMAIADDGRIYVAWLDERNVSQPVPSEKAEGHHMESNREVFMALSEDGGRTFQSNRRVAVDACPCCKTAIATGADHRVYLSWRQVLPGNFRHIAVASSADSGKTFSEPVIVSDDRWVLAGCPVSGPAITAGAGARVRVLWYSEGNAGATGLYWSESRDGGRTFSPRESLNAGQTTGTPVLTSNGNVVWTQGSGGSTRVASATLDGGGRVTPAKSEESGELPASAVTNDGLVIAYIAKPQEQRIVWLVKK